MARHPPKLGRADAQRSTAEPDRVDAVLSAASSRRCRRVLYHLRENDGVAFVDGIAERLSEDSVAGPEELAVELEHGVLPRLTDAGLVEHERETGLVISVGDPLGDELLAWLEDRERPGRPR